ncbi:TfuA-like protein [Photobacterium sp. MCCC 1A19761]|uniref:TfuA-like protein n=1 Tax=Photobacterium sp. MCCC 1A19761 TaxID=3115000 RepID=UPI00307DC622
MSIIVFSGPSLAQKDAAPLLTASYRPPAKQGDVYLATLDNPKMIVIIDGYFESVPAVWHKEILYAMSKGIHVFGCSSMGALRAAELEHFGMEGYGEVFESFASGDFEDDDEVALVHAPAEAGYIAASIPMVNIRATLDTAVDKQIIAPQQAKLLTQALKDVWYPERNYSCLLSMAKEILSHHQWCELEHHIETNAVDLKRLDAISLLKTLQAIDIEQLPAKQVNYSFTPTDAWERLVADVTHTKTSNSQICELQALWRETKLDGTFFQRRQQAICRKSALREAQKYAPDLNKEIIQRVLLELAYQRSACAGPEIDFDKLGQWLTTEHINMDEFHALVQRQGLIAWLHSIDERIDSELLDILKLDQSFAAYQARINSKKTMTTASLSELGINEEELWQWFFSVRLRQEKPKHVEDYWKICGFDSLEEMRTAVLKDYQYHYCQQEKAKDE